VPDHGIHGRERYEGQGEESAVLFAAASQVARPGVGGIVVTGDQTDHEVSILRAELSPGTGIETHFHRTFAESFFVLSGDVDFWTGERWLPGGSGDLFHVPRGGWHGLRNASTEDAELLVISTPGVPRERYVLELLELRESGRNLSSDEWREFFARHDQFPRHLVGDAPR
jgi:quercetin dioxygenase-like cupin family protein